jgi:Fur family ferric uptake transcriptional regulator
VEWEERLRALGQRATPARRAVLEVISSTSDHLSADEIAVAVGERVPDVHRATVFRTLERLVSLGVVTHVHLPHGAATYHLTGPGERMHLHLLCRGCGEVFDTDADLLDDVADRVGRSSGFVLDADHTALSGWCARCGVG